VGGMLYVEGVEIGLVEVVIVLCVWMLVLML